GGPAAYGPANPAVTGSPAPLSAAGGAGTGAPGWSG
ncbi:MAG: hypothetical protein QOE32_3332, partial [Pseudonocardiales bacterium]|nr:hypothetical protein [Pseudonocardiales bacterium]